MTTRKKPDGTVRIGGKDVSYARAAFMALEADRRQLTPLQISQVSLPETLPERVKIAGHLVDLPTAANIAEVAARNNGTPEWVLCNVLEKHTRPSKGRKTKRGKAKREP